MSHSFLLVPLSWGLLWGGLCVVLVAARLPTAPRRVGQAALACGLHALALVLPWSALAAMLGFAPAAANSPVSHSLDWTGKVAALLVSVLFMFGRRWVTPAEAGLRRPRPASLRVVGPVVGVAALAIFANAYAARQHFIPLWWHEGLYYSLAPGLEEELFYRGVLLGLLSPVFARTIPLPGTHTSWGGLVSVLLFGLAHVIKLSSIYFILNDLLMGDHLAARAAVWPRLLYFAPGEVAYPLAMGLLLLWVRERTGSVWVAAAAHCLLNAALAVVRLSLWGW